MPKNLTNHINMRTAMLLHVVAAVLAAMTHERILVATHAPDYLSTANYALLATYAVAYATLLTPMHCVLNETPRDSHVRNVRIRDGFWFANLAAVVVVAVELYALTALTPAKPGTPEFADCVLYIRLRVMNQLLLVAADYVVLALATLDKPRHVARLGLIRLAGVPAIALAGQLGYNATAFVTILTTLASLAYCAANFRRWNFTPPNELQSVRWALNWLLTGLFSGVQTTILIMTLGLVVCHTANLNHDPSVALTCKILALSVVPVVAHGETLKLTQRHESALSVRDAHVTTWPIATTLLFGLFPTLTSVLFGAQPDVARLAAEQAVKLTPYAVVLTANVIVSAKMTAEGLTALPAIATTLGSTGLCVTLAMTLPADTVMGGLSLPIIMLCVSIPVTTVINIALLRVARDYVASVETSTTPHGNAELT